MSFDDNNHLERKTCDMKDRCRSSLVAWATRVYTAQYLDVGMPELGHIQSLEAVTDCSK